MELRILARLELAKRRLLEELAEVESHYQQLSREIELKGIRIPWLDTVYTRAGQKACGPDRIAGLIRELVTKERNAQND